METRQLKKQLADTQQQRQRLLIAYEQGAIELEELSSRRKSLDHKSQALQHRLQRLEQENQEGTALDNLGENLGTVCRALTSGLGKMDMPQKMKLCSQLIERVVVDDHSAEIHYRFPVSTHCNPRGERGRLQLQAARVLHGCGARRLAETAAHRVGHVIPRVPPPSAMTSPEGQARARRARLAFSDAAAKQIDGLTTEAELHAQPDGADAGSGPSLVQRRHCRQGGGRRRARPVRATT